MAYDLSQLLTTPRTIQWHGVRGIFKLKVMGMANDLDLDPPEHHHGFVSSLTTSGHIDR